ncbi:lactadherin-like [Patiria miniata]|uniref:F5/8 type C domain-containing protein n=1 Tax=Patiria miniata TaxID=46514 RepID=A0A913ZT74_PATMI|nr:lactadherin-like [Patiria miniata]
MDCVASKMRACWIGVPPKPDGNNTDLRHLMKQLMESPIVRRRCPRRCGVLGELDSPPDGCSNPHTLGIEDGTIPDENFRASDSNDVNLPEMARLNAPTYWSPKFQDAYRWIEVDLIQTTRVSGIITQGQQLEFTSFLVSKFKVSYQSTPSSYEYVRTGNGDIQVFDGGDIKSASTPHTNYFNQSVMASVFRIYPQEWIVVIALRFELLQCSQD